MSKTKFVAFGEQGFWAYDVALHIFLKHLIDGAEASNEAGRAWLSDAISSWRTACIPDYGLTLETKYLPEQQKTFLALAEEACARIAARESISAREIASWPILGDIRIFSRGATEVHTAPIIELGRAMIALVNGQLPEAPQGQIWLYGAPEGRQAIGWKR